MNDLQHSYVSQTQASHYPSPRKSSIHQILWIRKQPTVKSNDHIFAVRALDHL